MEEQVKPKPPEVGELWKSPDGELWFIRDKIAGNFCWAVAVDKSKDCQFHWYEPGAEFVNCGWSRPENICPRCMAAVPEDDYVCCEACR